VRNSIADAPFVFETGMEVSVATVLCTVPVQFV
jgi:hypothetical protein